MANTQDTIFLKLVENETFNIKTLIDNIYADSLESLSKYIQMELPQPTQQLLDNQFHPGKVLIEVQRESAEISPEELNEEFLSFKMLIRQHIFKLFTDSLEFSSEEGAVVALSLAMDMSNVIDAYCDKTFPTAFVAHVAEFDSATYIFAPVDLLNEFSKHPDIFKYSQEQEKYLEAATTMAT